MRTGLLAVLLPFALATGCMYQSRVNQQLLERELRLEEDCIYRLKWQLEDTQRELAAAKLQVDSLQRQADVLRERGGAGPDLSAPLAPSGGAGSGGGTPRLPPPPRLPSVEPGIEAPPSRSGSGAGTPKSSAAPFKSGGSLVSQTGATAPDKSVLRPAERVNPDVNVEQIVLNPGLTGGLNAAGEPGSDHLSVVIEQRGANDARVLAPGDVSIVVVDPALPGSQSRIARWKFDADEVVQHVRRNRDGGSLHFELPWPTPPEHSDLRLFVRFTTYDGRRLEAKLPIEVQLADDGQGKWRKSKASLAGNEEERSNTRRSVYEPNHADDPPAKAESPERSAERGAPGWAPYR